MMSLSPAIFICYYQSMRKNIWVIAGLIGFVNAVVLYVFEFISVDFTYWLWTDLLGTDRNRWMVLPVAWVLGVFLTLTLLVFRETRLISPSEDILKSLDRAPRDLRSLLSVLTIGLMSLIAGASLGPEASLMIASVIIGGFASSKSTLSDRKALLILASIGALLVAFIDSMVLVLVPILLLLKDKKSRSKLDLKSLSVIAIASLSSFILTRAINGLIGGTGGDTAVPPLPQFKIQDLFIALAVGFLAGVLGLLLNWLMGKSWEYAKRLKLSKVHHGEYLAGLIFSTVLGIIYIIGGPTIQFSGSIGSGLLVQDAADIGVVTLLVMLFSKIIATAWSKAVGYRGGLVFPSIYMGIALGLFVGQLFVGLAGSGAIVGGISGMMAAALGSPIIAAVFLFAVLPWSLWPVAVFAVVGTASFGIFLRKINRN